MKMTDLISRQAAIDTVHSMYKRCDTGDITDYRDLMYESFAVLPSVHRWIPVTERLPGMDVDVLVTCEYKGKRIVDLGSLGSYADGVECWCLPSDEYAIGDYAINKKITAWMPLPEPYKGEK